MARYSWEVTQVNEMLTWMERHPLPFACTTNAPDLLDPATVRRFLPMDEGQIAAKVDNVNPRLERPTYSG